MNYDFTEEVMELQKENKELREENIELKRQIENLNLLVTMMKG